MIINTINSKNNLHLGFLPAFIFLALGMFHVLCVVDWFSAMPNFVNDVKFDQVILEHIFTWVQAANYSWHDLWSPRFFYPFEGLLAFSNSNFGSVPVYLAFRSLGADQFTAFSGWFFSGYILNYLAALYVLRRLGFNFFSAAAGAYVYAFALPTVYLEFWGSLNYRFAIPMAFLSFWLLLREKKIRHLSHLTFWVMWQFYCTIYLGVFLVYLLLATLIAYWYTYKESIVCVVKNIWASNSIKTSLANIIISLFYFSLIASMLMQYHSITYGDYNFSRPISEVLNYLPTLSDYLPDNLASSCFLSTNNPNYSNTLCKDYVQHPHLFLGFGVFIVLISGFWVAFKFNLNYELAKVSFVVLLLLFLVSLKVGGFSIYNSVASLPGISSMRVMYRIILVMLLPVSIVISIACQYYTNKFVKDYTLRKYIPHLLLAMLLTIEVSNSPVLSTPISEVKARQNSLKEKLPITFNKESIIYVSPEIGNTITEAVEFELDGMILAQSLGVATLNGYTGFPPPNTRIADACISYKNRLYAYRDFRHKADSFVEDMLKNVIVINSSNPCTYEPLLPLADLISRQVANEIEFEIYGEVLNKNFNGKIVITNNSTEPFSSVSQKNDVQLLWRIYPLFEPTAENMKFMPATTWVVKQIPFSIMTGESYIHPLHIELPDIQGKYRIQVSMVQPGGIWFHTADMKVPQLDIEIF